MAGKKCKIGWQIGEKRGMVFLGKRGNSLNER